MVVIRLSPAGRKGDKVYKIVAADRRDKLTGRYIEKLGIFIPRRTADRDSKLELNQERYDYWLKQGAIPSERLNRVVRIAALSPEEQKARLEREQERRARQAKKKETSKAAEGGEEASA